jgi:glycogen synthase
MLSDLQAEFPTRQPPSSASMKSWRLIYAAVTSFDASRFEPCGLGQLMPFVTALCRWCVAPVAWRTPSRTGDSDPEFGTGFTLRQANAQDVEHAIERALALRETRRPGVASRYGV